MVDSSNMPGGRQLCRPPFFVIQKGSVPMSRKPLSVTDNVEAKCTRCNAILNHTIVAMVEGRIVRVKCNTCQGEHNYRTGVVAKKSATASDAVKKAKTAGTAAAKGTKKDPAAAERAEWETISPGFNPDKAAAYAMTGKFRMNSLVQHPSFGLGIVKKVLIGKVEILFKDGIKLLKSA